MKSTEDQQYQNGDIRQVYQGVPLTFEDVLKLHGVKDMPFLDTPELQAFAVRSMESILKRHNPEWIKQYSSRLVRELEHIAEM